MVSFIRSRQLPYMRRLLLSTVLSLFFLFSLFAQAQKDSTFITRFPQEWQVVPNLVFRRWQFSFNDNNGNLRRYRMANLGAGVKGSYKGIALNLVVPVVRFYDIGEASLTERIGVAIGFERAKFYAYGSFFRFKGFESDAPGNPTRSDIDAFYANVQGYYLRTGDKFSMSSSLGMVTRQENSKGSLLISFLVNYQSVNADSLPLLGGEEAFNKFRNVAVGSGIGYAHNLSVNKWYLTAGGSVGGELQYDAFGMDDIEGDDFRFRIGPAAYAYGAAGYNGDRFFGGVLARYAPGLSFEQSLSSNTDLIEARLQVGIRL